MLGMMIPPAVFSFGIQTTDHHPIMQRAEFHWIFSNLLPAVES
jgi:hypothetical protein